ncbi:14835_t:CDS:1, partial [Funneliformis caledonium]
QSSLPSYNPNRSVLGNAIGYIAAVPAAATVTAANSIIDLY